MEGNKLITRLAVTFTILVSMLTLSCSKQEDKTASEILKLKTRVETVTVGYKDGTTILLTKDSAQYEGILNECLEGIVAIDQHVTLTLTIEDLDRWKPHNKYVLINFDSPIVLVTLMLVQEEERYRIPHNTDGFQVLTPKTVILPLSDTDKGAIWLTKTGETTYSVWVNNQWTYLRLEELVDELRH